METHIDGTNYGVSYRGYNVWRLIWREQSLEIHKKGTIYGGSYRGYNVWRPIKGTKPRD